MSSKLSSNSQAKYKKTWETCFLVYVHKTSIKYIVKWLYLYYLGKKFLLYSNNYLLVSLEESCILMIGSYPTSILYRSNAWYWLVLNRQKSCLFLLSVATRAHALTRARTQNNRSTHTRMCVCYYWLFEIYTCRSYHLLTISCSGRRAQKYLTPFNRILIA